MLFIYITNHNFVLQFYLKSYYYFLSRRKILISSNTTDWNICFCPRAILRISPITHFQIILYFYCFTSCFYSESKWNAKDVYIMKPELLSSTSQELSGVNSKWDCWIFFWNHIQGWALSLLICIILSSWSSYLFLEIISKLLSFDVLLLNILSH